MKKIIFAFLLMVGASTASNAQLGDLTKQASSLAGAAGFDVNKLTSGIMGKLTPGLALTALQQPKVTEAITGFLGKKADILGLMKSDPTKYASQFGGLFKGLTGSLGGILAKDQMTKFMGMKPATNNPTNVLSNLFF
jgi:hypothetical protein